ncbi:hypothetical protein DV515_00010027 [Chloebia gouldiae]|uniref:Uncharacterized protein n=1 Tax=Chloebia gouldiae TaxID=44316 RepID=A0A3L8SAI3_CHLGU|nr:hypothetical protein DV515_00010027 [Chloebia gouldiae]
MKTLTLQNLCVLGATFSVLQLELEPESLRGSDALEGSGAVVRVANCSRLWRNSRCVGSLRGHAGAISAHKTCKSSFLVGASLGFTWQDRLQPVLSFIAPCLILAESCRALLMLGSRCGCRSSSGLQLSADTSQCRKISTRGAMGRTRDGKIHGSITGVMEDRSCQKDVPEVWLAKTGFVPRCETLEMQGD